MLRILSMIVLLFLSGDGITVENPWLRPGAERMATALYFTIQNKSNQPDTLYAIESDISTMIKIHETYSTGDVIGMKEIGHIIVEADSSEMLEPGGKHIMVMNLKMDLTKGESINFILHFKRAGEIPITAEVKE